MFARGVSLPDGQVRPSLPETQKSDGALILYNPATQEEFDFWQATTVADQFGGVEGPTIVRAGEVAWFCIGVDAPGCQLPVCEFGRPGSLWRGSCRSTGVPYLAGLLVPEDFKSQSGIPHALAFTLPRLRYIEETSSGVPANHVYPATATEHETDNSTSNPFALAAGMRLRFGSTVVDKNGNAVNEAALAPVTKLFFQALRKYGAYLLDAAGAFGFAAEDQWTAPLELSIPDLADLVGTTVESISATIDNGKTQWEILMSKLREEVEQIPFAVSANQGNFEVIADAKLPPPQ
jgi:hypothetical protein